MSAIAYFVSSHGCGHAARAAAVLSSLRRLRSPLEIHVFTSVPRWFFDDSLEGPFDYHPLRTDVGLEQGHPFDEDLAATVAALHEFWQGMPTAATAAAGILSRHGVGLTVSDISPLGLAAAAAAGLTGVLVENFTWDWIYRGYVREEPRLEEFARRSAELFDGAGLRVQAEPVCVPRAGAVRVPPVGRGARSSRAQVRGALGLAPDDPRPLVLLTMGGMGWRSAASGALPARETFFVSLGGVDSPRREANRVSLPDRSPIYPPDLVAAADLVVAKIGYSTLAECYRAGARLLFLERPRFVESAVLAEFARREMGAEALPVESLDDGTWLEAIPRMLARPRPAAGEASGADEIARRLLARLA